MVLTFFEMKFRQILPKEWFKTWENTVFYPWALSQETLWMIDENSFDQLPQWLKNINAQTLSEINWFDFEAIKIHEFKRHNRSAYNTYKAQTIGSERHNKYMAEEDPEVVKKMAEEYWREFVSSVNIDSLTDLSEEWHEQWRSFTPLVWKRINENPELMRDRIIISPHKRTRLTAYYDLKWIEWLDFDVDLLKLDPHETNHTWYFEWSFQGKPVEIVYLDDVIERSHWKIGLPWFIQQKLDAVTKPFEIQQLLSQEQRNIESYYNWVNWWESNLQISARVRWYLRSLDRMTTKKRTRTYRHHLWIVNALNVIWKPNIFNFNNFNNYWKPENWSLTTFVKIPETVTWLKGRMRVAAYNLMLEE